MTPNRTAPPVARRLAERPAAPLLPLPEVLVGDEVTEDRLLLREEIRLLTEETRLLTEETSPETLETRLESEEEAERTTESTYTNFNREKE